MRTLCTDCIQEYLDALDPKERGPVFQDIALGGLRLTIYPRNCDHAKRPAHSQRGPYTLDELPPSARG